MITSTTSSTTTSSTASAAANAMSQAAQPGGALGQDQFMKLLIAQMQNQDPMNPMQGDQMASELAQFSSLSELTSINSTLTSQSSAQGSLLGAVQSTAAINTLGHTVIAQGNQVQIGGANGQSTVMADVATNAATATLHIYNSAGTEVGTRSLGAISAGNRQTFNIGGAADGLAPGTYTYAIDGKDASGNAVNVTTYESGKVDGVSSSGSGIVLNSGGLTIPYAQVVQVIN